MSLGVNTHSIKYAKMYAVKSNIIPYKPFEYKKKTIESFFHKFMKKAFE